MTKTSEDTGGINADRDSRPKFRFISRNPVIANCQKAYELTPNRDVGYVKFVLIPEEGKGTIDEQIAAWEKRIQEEENGKHFS